MIFVFFLKNDLTLVSDLLWFIRLTNTRGSFIEKEKELIKKRTSIVTCMARECSLDQNDIFTLQWSLLQASYTKWQIENEVTIGI